MPIEVQLILAGAIGSLAHDLVKENKLAMPRLSDGCLYLGFIGGMVVGAFVGFLVDNNMITALLAGYVGTSAIKHLLPNIESTSSPV